MSDDSDDDDGFEFQPDYDGNVSLESAVYQALGAASMCWEEPGPLGLYKPERAAIIGAKLLDHIYRVASWSRL